MECFFPHKNFLLWFSLFLEAEAHQPYMYLCIYTLQEGGEQGYANPPIRGIFRPDPSIRLNFCSNPNPCYLLFHGIQKVALQHEKINYLIQSRFCNRNRCGTSCLRSFHYSFKTLSIRDRAYNTIAYILLFNCIHYVVAQRSQSIDW